MPRVLLSYPLILSKITRPYSIPMQSTDSSTAVNASLIQERIEHIRSQIPPDVTIVAVSKGFSPYHIRAAYHAGLRHFGESRIQEAQQKQPELQDCPEIIWHLIGHLQTNKAKQALQLFSHIDSVDSLKLADLINQKAVDMGCCPQICLQVKLAPDPSKYGWTPSELLEACPQLNQLRSVLVHGLMTILPLGLAESEMLQLFFQLKQFSKTICDFQYPHLQPKVLSMGMSSDYQLAVQAGATEIRLGRALFA